MCAANYGNGQDGQITDKKKSKGLRRARNEKNKPQPQEPQVWITLLWHMSLRLPWKWKLGPSNSAERIHVMEMIGEKANSWLRCFAAMQSFVGYPL